MKKKLILMILPLFIICTDIQTAPGDHFYTVRETADAMKGVISGIKLLVDGVAAPINEYGVDEVVKATTGGVTRTIEGKEITFEIKAGTFLITSGIAKDKNFEYVAIIKEKAPAADVKILFYFNTASNTDSLTVSIPGYFSTVPPSYVTALEAYCSSFADGTKEMLVSIASDQTVTPRSSMRFIVRDNDAEVSVMALAYHKNSTSSISGYYTLGFIAEKAAPNLSTAFQGAASSAVMSNNGYDFPGGTVSYNYGYFYNDGGVPAVPEFSVAAEDSEYPSFSSTNALFTSMQDQNGFFYAGTGADASALETLSIDITEYPVQ